MRKVTSAEVARRAGVSQSAVSRVFTPGASASARTAERVRRAAAELGYRPNVLARAMDGIIAASISMSSDLAQRCSDIGVPLVFFNRTQGDARFPAVTSDNFAGGRAVADFLVAGGHRRIGYLAGWEGASTQRDREAGFRAGLSAAGLALTSRGVGNFQKETAEAATRQMCAAEPLDALFVGNDYMAFSAMDVLRAELGLRVPEDISVVGFDDVPPAAWAAYDLTTVRQRANAMVDATVELLMDQIADPKAAPKVVEINAPLVVRGSARRPEGWQ